LALGRLFLRYFTTSGRWLPCADIRPSPEVRPAGDCDPINNPRIRCANAL
jgi:hypothetical protein